jgi:hypothetical protein
MRNLLLLFVCVSFTTTAAFDAWGRGGSEKSTKQGERSKGGRPSGTVWQYPSDPAFEATEPAAAPGASPERRTPNYVVDPNAPPSEEYKPGGDATPPPSEGGPTVEVEKCGTTTGTYGDKKGVCVKVGGSF